MKYFWLFELNFDTLTTTYGSQLEELFIYVFEMYKKWPKL